MSMPLASGGGPSGRIFIEGGRPVMGEADGGDCFRAAVISISTVDRAE